MGSGLRAHHCCVPRLLAHPLTATTRARGRRFLVLYDRIIYTVLQLGTPAVRAAAAAAVQTQIAVCVQARADCTTRACQV